MSTTLDHLDALPTKGRVGLLERASVRSPESALALASVTAEAARSQGGRLVWAGHVDQIFIGDERRPDDEVLVSEFPSKKQASDALAERLEWGMSHLVHASHLSAFRPATATQKGATRLFFAAQRCRGRKTPVADLSAPDVLERDLGAPEHAPSAAALQHYVSCGIEGKVVMLNLLRFKRDAGGDTAAGRAAYARYGRRTAALIARLGGGIRAQGAHVVDLTEDGVSGGSGANGESGEYGDAQWDAVALVQYPSRADFIGMLTSPAYTPGHADRDAGLERTELIVCTSHATFF